MKQLTQVATTAAILAITLSGFAGKAFAETTQSATTTTTCTTGAYGQNNCYSVTNQNVNTQVLGTTVTHKPVNAGLDLHTTSVAVTTLVTSATGAVITLKKLRQ